MPRRPRARTRRSFGRLDKLPSGRWRARYIGPDDQLHTAPFTFDTKADADAWLAVVRASIVVGKWTPDLGQHDGRGVETVAGDPDDPGRGLPTFATYAPRWLERRKGLKPRTVEHYESILNRHLLPAFGELRLDRITADAVRQWHSGLTTGPTMSAHAYSLLRTVLHEAVNDELIVLNPCRIRGAGNSKRVVKIKPATVDELAAIRAAMPEQYRLLVDLAAWTALRFGELVALRRCDIEPDGSVIRVRRAIVRVRGAVIEGTPKSDAGIRDIVVPPHLHPDVVEHLEQHAQPGTRGLLFPSATGEALPYVTMHKFWDRARRAAGRDDLRLHDLRHTGATMAAQAGATLAELMSRLGHATPGAALRYQHAATGRDAVIAATLSQMITQGNQS